MGPGQTAWYFFILNLARLAFLTLGGVKGVHEERVPRQGGLIVAPLHVSHLDPPAVACGTNRRLRFMAKEELFKGWLGKLITSLGAFPVRRGETDTESIRKAMDLINKGEAVLIFPEGTRGDTKTMGPINRGVAMLAKRTGAQVVPVGVVGTHKAWPKGSKLKRSKIRLVYGEPFTYEQIATSSNEKENREAFALKLETEIRKLCKEQGLKIDGSAEGLPRSADRRSEGESTHSEVVKTQTPL